MVARHQHHERLLGHHPVFQIEVRFDTEKGHVEPATSERIGEVRGIVAGDRIMSNLSGKTALVTGASRGIGRASALALAKAGAQVLVHYSSRGKEAEAVVAEIRQAGGRAEKVAADLRTPNGPHALAKLVHGIVGSRLA